MFHLGISYPNPTIGQQLRKVEIRLKVELYLADLEDGGAWTSRLDWKYLLVEEEDQEAGIPTYTWQRCIQNLKHLRLVLDFIATGYDMEDMMMMAMGTADVSRLPLMKSYRTHLQADFVEVAVGHITGYDKIIYSGVQVMQAQRYAEAIVTEVEGMIHVREKDEAPYRAWKTWEELIAKDYTGPRYS